MTGFITAIDLGIGGAVHSSVKQPDGRRMALQLLRKVYGQEDLIADGPTLAAAACTAVSSVSVGVAIRIASGIAIR